MLNKRKLLPSHIALLEDVENAKELIGKDIWLNDIFSDTFLWDNREIVLKNFKKLTLLM